MIFASIAYAAEAAESATESAQNTGLLASLGINLSSFIFQLINFAVVALVIWYLILKPVTKKMAERQKLIDESINNAKKVQENLQKSEQKYQEKIDQAKVDANKIIEKAGAEAERLSAELRDKAKKEIELLVLQARKNIIIEKDEMVATLKTETANLIIKALEKILSEKIDNKKDQQIIEEMLNKLK